MPGKVAATLSALLGGYATQTDHAAVTATFLNAAAAPPARRDRLADRQPGRPQLGDRAGRPVGLGGGAGGHPPDLRAHRRHPRRGLLQRRLHRQRQPRARLRRAAPVFHKTRRGQARQRQGRHPPAGQQAVRRPHGLRRHPARLDGRRRSAGVVELTLGAQGGRQRRRPRSSTRASSRSRRPARITELALAEPLASCRGAAAAARRRRRRSSATSGATARARSARRASTARPPCAARSGSCKDSCAGTLTRVVRGTVTVRDKVRHKTVTVAAGKSYLAKPSAAASREQRA